MKFAHTISLAITALAAAVPAASRSLSEPLSPHAAPLPTSAPSAEVSRDLFLAGLASTDRACAAVLGGPSVNGRKSSIKALGDVDGDGRNDLAITTLGTDGAVEVQIGSRSQAEVMRTHRFPGAEVSSVERMSDLDGDSIADYAVGAVTRGIDRKGTVHAFSGATGEMIFRTVLPQAQLGFRIAEIGDFDLDGVSDLAVEESDQARVRPSSALPHLISGHDGSSLSLSRMPVTAMVGLIKKALGFPSTEFNRTAALAVGDCRATISVVSVQPMGACVAACHGVAYTVDQFRQAPGNNGSCRILYKVTRHPDGKEFSDVVNMACPSTKSLTFYCDDDELCPAMEITFECLKD